MTVTSLLLLSVAATAFCAPQRQPEPQTIGAPGADTSPKPLWYPQFQVDFNETMGLFFFQARTRGKWWYDAVAGVEVIDRVNGQGDRYCGSIHPFTPTPCRHLVTQGNRWLDDAEFLGTTHLYGKEVYKWNKRGMQDNFYYTTADEDQLPVELYQVPNDRQTLDTSTFTPEGITPDLIEVPRYCKPKCPLTSVCTFLRVGGNSAHGKESIQEPF